MSAFTVLLFAVFLSNKRFFVANSNRALKGIQATKMYKTAMLAILLVLVGKKNPVKIVSGVKKMTKIYACNRKERPLVVRSVDLQTSGEVTADFVSKYRKQFLPSMSALSCVEG